MVLLRSLAGAAKVAKTFGGSPAVAQIDERVSLPANIGGGECESGRFWRSYRSSG